MNHTEFDGKCQRCQSIKIVRKIDWNSHGDKVAEKKLCEDCYYELEGFPL